MSSRSISWGMKSQLCLDWLWHGLFVMLKSPPLWGHLTVYAHCTCILHGLAGAKGRLTHLSLSLSLALSLSLLLPLWQRVNEITVRPGSLGKARRGAYRCANRVPVPPPPRECKMVAQLSGRWSFCQFEQQTCSWRGAFRVSPCRSHAASEIMVRCGWVALTGLRTYKSSIGQSTTV